MAGSRYTLGMNPCTLALGCCCLAAASAQAAEIIAFLNYPECVKLENDHVRVILGSDVGGRVLEYSHRGVNVLYLDPAEADWKPGAKRAPASAGRFDVGPELVVPARPELLTGKWSARVTGPRSARLSSPPIPAMGIRVDRDFQLDADSSRLVCTQTLHNLSDRPVEYCHWSRTFAVGGGVAWVPLTEPSRFPSKYVMYETMDKILNRPKDPHIVLRDGFVEILAAPAQPKLGFDSHAGWFAYQAPNGLLFIKRYPTYPDRVYNELAGLTLSIWYPQGKPMIELEPIGPRMRIAPGASDSFTEEWWLLPSPMLKPGDKADLARLSRRVQNETRPPGQ